MGGITLAAQACYFVSIQRRWGRHCYFFRTLTGDENFSRIAEIFRGNLTLIVIALIVIVPLKVIHRWSSNTIVEHLSGDSATILTVGKVS